MRRLSRRQRVSQRRGRCRRRVCSQHAFPASRRRSRRAFMAAIARTCLTKARNARWRLSTGTPFTLTDDGVGQGGPVIGIGFDATNGYSTFLARLQGEFAIRSSVIA